MTLGEAANYLGVSRISLTRWLAVEPIPTVTVGKRERVRRADLAAWIEAHLVEPGTVRSNQYEAPVR